MSRTLEDKNSKKKLWLVILAIILLLLILLVCYFLFWAKPAIAPELDEVAQPTETIVYVEDDSMWLPDAVIESNDQILEMKFGF